jgi:hypothetical protein
MRWAVPVTSMDETRNAYKILNGKYAVKVYLGHTGFDG